jgi:hypothetical protein
MSTVVVATYAYRHQAEFARETLKGAGIESVLIADDAGGAYAGMSFTRPVRLLVHTEDEQEARDILEEDEAGEADGEEA